VRCAAAQDEAGFLAAVDELDDAVVAQGEALREEGDGGRLRGTGDLEQELMLLGGETDVGRGLLAEVEEAAEGVAEVGEVRDGRARWKRGRVGAHKIYRITI
jgi:hypothetical protein